jgi:hypothetical protein
VRGKRCRRYTQRCPRSADRPARRHTRKYFVKSDSLPLANARNLVRLTRSYRLQNHQLDRRLSASRGLGNGSTDSQSAVRSALGLGAHRRNHSIPGYCHTACRFLDQVSEFRLGRCGPRAWNTYFLSPSLRFGELRPRPTTRHSPQKSQISLASAPNGPGANFLSRWSLSKCPSSRPMLSARRGKSGEARWREWRGSVLASWGSPWPGI